MVLILAGCDRKGEQLSTERSELVLRFFNSMKLGDAEAAARQGEKLRAMDSGNDFVGDMVSIQQGNSFIRRAQSKLDGGEVNAALVEVERGLSAYPANRALLAARGQLRQLRHADKLLTAMREAKTSSEKTAALTAASTGLSSNISPALAKYFAEYRASIDKSAAAAEPKVN